MIRLFIIGSLLAFGFTLRAQNKPAAVSEKLTPGAALLFKNVHTQATVAQKNRLFQDLKLTLAPDQKGFTMGEYTVDTYVFPTDLNKDGQEELFIGFGSVALFGNTGEHFSLFMKTKSGAYKQVHDFGGRPVILKTANLGYPDIMVGGPGFEFPVHRWNGRGYDNHRVIKDGSLNNSNSKDIEEYRKAYSAAVKR